MRYLNTLTIKNRLISAYLILLVLFVAFAVFSIVEIQVVGKLTRKLYDHPLQVSNAALKASMGIVKMHRSMKDVVFAQSEEELADDIEKVAFEESLVLDNLDIVRDNILGAKGELLENEARKSFLGWQTIRKEVIRLVVNGDIKAASRMTKTRSAEHVVFLERYMTDLVSYARNKAGGFIEDADSSQTGVVRKVIIFICMVILILIISGYILISGVLENIMSLNYTMSEITRTGRLSQANMTGNHEIADMARYFNKMVESLTTLSAVQKGVRGVDRIMVASTSLDDFGMKFIEELMGSTGSAFGAFYLFNSKNKSFTHISSVGLKNEYMKSFDEDAFAGIFDRACSTQKIEYMNEIPQDTVFTIKTIAGNALPRCLVTVPIVIQGEVAAIIALGSLHDYSETASGILEQIQVGVGPALSNILSGEKTVIMAEKLKSSNVELEAQTQELQAMTEDLKEQNVELDMQGKQLEEANRLKSVFLSNMSHELRTPLNSVMALSSVLKMNASKRLKSEEVEYLDVIERNGKRLLDLINDILDLSKIEAGRMDVVLSFFPFNTTIENIIDSIRPLAKEKELSVNVELAANLPDIQSDEKRVHQILLNLIGNAIKFTEKGGVTVEVRSDSRQIYVKVMDTGIGISEKDLSYIFEEFKQVDGSTSRRHEGTGLGLAIAYRATKNLGGDLTVESRAGLGTSFILTLPLRWQGRDISEIPLMNQLQQTEIIQEQKTVLVVDDEPSVVELISDYLSREGYNTITTVSGSEALLLAEEHQPFAITLDLVMPEMDGLEILQRLKKNPATSEIPVVIVSVSDDRKTGFALGALGHVTKPVIKDDLIKEINRACVRPASVMVADDSDVDRNMIMQMIDQEKMLVTGAENGKECIEKIRHSVPDVLLLDLMMPEMDGFGVLEELRRNSLTMALPVIIVTAKDLTQEEKHRLNQYVVSVLYKSGLTSENLLEGIGQSLRKIRMPESPKFPPPVQTGKRILVVEDNESAIVQMRMILEQEGYLVDIASGGRDAVEIVERTIPDGIILDLMMPDVDGFEVLERVRGTEKTREIPVLILTAKDLTPDDFKKLSANNIQQLVQKGDVEREGILLKLKIMLGEKPKTMGNVSSHAAHIEKTAIKPRTIPILRNKVSDTTQTKILVIEDNPDNLITLRAVLKNSYDIVEATDGEKGLETAFQELPDVILLDISLPGMDGYAVVKKLKADEKTSHIPVIALTAHAMVGDRDKIISAGCNDYLSKPINPGKIIETIERWLGEIICR